MASSTSPSSSVPRRQLPQPESTTSRSQRRIATGPPLRKGLEKNWTTSPPGRTTDGSDACRRLLPSLEEPAKRTRKEAPVQQSIQQEISASTYQQNVAESDSTRGNQTSAPKRGRFAPQLIETTRRSRKSGDITPALLPTDKTDLSPGDKSCLPRHLNLIKPDLLATIVPKNTPVTSAQKVLRTSESHFSSKVLSHKVPRRQSFRVPDLAPIQSQPDSEASNDSSCPSLSTSPSIASNQTDPLKHASRLRESCDDRFSGYLLALAARAAEKQFREQAMAAYPNENMHEPVDHFAIDRDSDTSDEVEGIGLLPQGPENDDGLARRDSAVGWDIREMRRHQEKLGEQQRQFNVTEQADQGQSNTYSQDTDRMIEVRSHKPDAGRTLAHPNDRFTKRPELQQMRSAASPPMLGQDLLFPKSQSPQQTRFEIGQYPQSHKTSLGETGHDHIGLWTPIGNPSRRGSVGGLWRGYCAAPGNDSNHVSQLLQTGLMTPQVEKEDPFVKLILGEKDHSPSSPGSSAHSKISGLCGAFSIEQVIEAEFHDGFVTQVYNYLSLGYPSLARKYDDELRKISRVPLRVLRKDDKRKNTKGYIGAPEGSGSDLAGVQHGQCGRWEALRLYIHEWARQQPRMVERDTGANNDWGVRARRGSWAI